MSRAAPTPLIKDFVWFADLSKAARRAQDEAQQHILNADTFDTPEDLVSAYANRLKIEIEARLTPSKLLSAQKKLTREVTREMNEKGLEAFMQERIESREPSDLHYQAVAGISIYILQEAMRKKARNYVFTAHET